MRITVAEIFQIIPVSGCPVTVQQAGFGQQVGCGIEAADNQIQTGGFLRNVKISLEANSRGA